MKILLLGGSGYLGSRLAIALAKKGNEVICTKRASSNIEKLQNAKLDNIICIPASLEAIEATLQYTSFDCVVNAVCNYGRNSVLYDNVIEANIEFPLKVLNKVTECGSGRFITIGTGLPDDLNMYSFSKKTFSNFGEFYVRNQGIDFFNMKLEMFYGADEPEDRFIPSLIRKMLNGDVVDVTAGTQHRDIIFIDDVVNAIIKVIEDEKLKGYHEIPVGTGTAPTISELVDYIWEQTGKVSVVNKGAVPMRKNEPDCCADISVLQSIGEWEPVFWKDGIKHMISEIGKGEK